MGNMTREQILARKLGRDTVDLPDGGTIEVRGLNRREAMHVSALEDHYDRDVYLVATGMVDPVMTEDDVRAWGDQDDSGTMEIVSQRIGELSRMVEGAGKSRVSRARRRS